MRMPLLIYHDISCSVDVSQYIPISHRGGLHISLGPEGTLKLDLKNVGMVSRKVFMKVTSICEPDVAKM